MAATARLQQLALLGEIACDGDERDDFDRLLAVCDAYDGTPINETLVAEGLAWAFVRYSDEFVDEEAEARNAGRGIWLAPTQPAWEYRAELRANIIDAQPLPPTDCMIKGNINRDGERIFHVPGSSSYEGTVIRVENGERWFCSEDEALAAGWRAPRGW